MYKEFWASMYAKWTKCRLRENVTEKDREDGVTDADKAIKELKVSHY